MREFFRHITAALFMLALGGLIVACCSCTKRSDAKSETDWRVQYICSKADTTYIVWRNEMIAPLLDIDGNPVECGKTGLERKDWQD